MNITNASGADVIGGLGQGLQPIGTQVTGYSTTSNWILGVIILLLLLVIMVARRASLELIGLVMFFAIWGLTTYGLLPQVIFWAAMLIAAGVIVLAFLKWRGR